EHRRGEDEWALDDRLDRLESPRGFGCCEPALLMEEDDELVLVQVEVFGVVAEESLRVHGAGQRHVVAVLECLEELLADARVRRRLVELDAALLALRAKDLAQLRHLGVVTSASRAVDVPHLPLPRRRADYA